MPAGKGSVGPGATFQIQQIIQVASQCSASWHSVQYCRLCQSMWCTVTKLSQDARTAFAAPPTFAQSGLAAKQVMLLATGTS